MTTRHRLTAEGRRAHLLEVASDLFAGKPYDAVSMDEVAKRAGISRALLYRHFQSKRDLFAGVYQQAADRLLEQTTLSPDVPLAEQVAAGLEAHIDYFAANRTTVLAANRTLAGDPVIQAIIEGELDVLRQRMLDVTDLDDDTRQAVSSALVGWLVFVRVLSVEWLTHGSFSRTQLRDMCVGALLGALDPIVDLPDRTRGLP